MWPIVWVKSGFFLPFVCTKEKDLAYSITTHLFAASLCYIPMDPTGNTSSVDLCSKKESTFADADRKEIISRLLSDLTNHIHCSHNHKACSSYYCSSTIRKYRFPFQTGKLAGKCLLS